MDMCLGISHGLIYSYAWLQFRTRLESNKNVGQQGRQVIDTDWISEWSYYAFY